MWEVSREKRVTRQCQACRKDDSLPIKEWSPDVQGWACSLCIKEEERITSIRKELEMLKVKVAAKKRGKGCKENVETPEGGMDGWRLGLRSWIVTKESP